MSSKQIDFKDPSHTARIYALPSLFTAGNLFFGFLAIIRCIQAKYAIDTSISSVEYYTQAVWFILLAFICDTLDGRVARLGGQETLFGKEFDSLADIVSFGVAPALMVFFLILSPTEGFPVFRQVGWIIGFFYLLCCAIRLSRFNVITHPLLPETEAKKDNSNFVGLPVPAAAALIASLVLVLTRLNLPSFVWFSMPILMLMIASLMISTIPYPSFKNINHQTKIRARTFVGLIALVGIVFMFKEYSFAVIFISYIFYGLIRYLKNRLISRKK